MSPREQVVNGGDGYIPSAGINGQYGGTWSGGQSFSSGYGQPSNGGQGGYDSGAGAIVAGNGPSGNGPAENGPPGNIAGNTGGVTLPNPRNGGIVGNGGGTPKPTPISTPGATTSYYTYFYTINDVDYKPGQTYRGSDGQLYRIPFPSATPNPNLHRREKAEEEQNEKEEEASMSVVEFDEGSGLNEDDVKLYNGIQDTIRAMDEAADELNDLVAEIYLGEDEVVSIS